MTGPRKFGKQVLLSRVESCQEKERAHFVDGTYCFFFLTKTNQKAGSSEIMIPRKQEIWSPKFCSKGSCSPQQLLQKHSVRVHPSHVFARRTSMCAAAIPSFLWLLTAPQTTLPVPCPSSCTQRTPFSHPFHFTSGSLTLKGTGHTWGQLQHKSWIQDTCKVTWWSGWAEKLSRATWKAKQS